MNKLLVLIMISMVGQISMARKAGDNLKVNFNGKSMDKLIAVKKDNKKAFQKAKNYKEEMLGKKESCVPEAYQLAESLTRNLSLKENFEFVVLPLLPLMGIEKDPSVPADIVFDISASKEKVDLVISANSEEVLSVSNEVTVIGKDANGNDMDSCLSEKLMQASFMELVTNLKKGLKANE